MNEGKSIKDQAQESRLFLAVRIRGTVGDNPSTELTVKSLGMEGKFNARIVPANPDMIGMLRRAKDLVTWGELEQETLSLILGKRAEKSGPGSHKLDQDFAKLHFQLGSLDNLAENIVSGNIELARLWKAGVKPTIRLHPPKGGFKRSTKRAYNSMGELGYRGHEINRLVRRMI